MAKGRYLELTLDALRDSDSSLRDRIEEALRRAWRELEAYERATGDLTGSATVTVGLRVERVKNSQEFVNIEEQIGVKPPKRARANRARAGGARLLATEDGESTNDADQQLLPRFDRYGNPADRVDAATGEVVADHDAGDVAGTIARKNRA